MSSGPLERFRAYAGSLTLLGALLFASAFVITAVPNHANRVIDAGLHRGVEAVPRVTSDLHLSTTGASAAGDRVSTDVTTGSGRLEPYRQKLPAQLRAITTDQWFAAQIKGLTAFAPYPPFNGLTQPVIGLRTQDGAQASTRLTGGRWPANRLATGVVQGQAPSIEAAISAASAELLSLRVGSVFTLGLGKVSVTTANPQVLPAQATLQVTIVGIFTVNDPKAAPWDDEPLAVDAVVSGQFNGGFEAVAMTDTGGLATATTVFGPATCVWRYRVDPNLINASEVDSLVTAVAHARSRPVAQQVRLQTSLDTVLLRYTDQLNAARALLAVVAAGLVATLLSLVLLAGRGVVERRRDELALLRARGAGAFTTARRTLADVALPGVPATGLGWWAGLTIPGRQAGTTWLLLGVAALGMLAVAAMAVADHRSPTTRPRSDLATDRPSARRLVAEASLVLVAVVGVVLLRRRGLPQAGGVDGYLACVPVLVSLAAGVLMLRILPFPLRYASGLAAKGSGTSAFLGLARSARSAAVVLAPLAVLVIAIATGVFSAAVAGSVGAARDTAADLEVGGAARIDGNAFVPEATDRLARLPGVSAVSAITVEASAILRPGGSPSAVPLATAQVIVVDVATYREVLRRSGINPRLPSAFTAPSAGTGPVPALISRSLAATLPGSRVVATRVRERDYTFVPAAVTAGLPGLGGTGRFVILPQQPATGLTPLAPTRFLVALTDGAAGDKPISRHGAGLTSALRAEAAAGQRAYFDQVAAGSPAQPRPQVSVTTWAGYRAGLDSTGINGVVTFTFTAGALGAALLGLFAIGFSVLAGAGPRGRVLSLLRTQGLSARQGRGLLLYELAPLIGAATLSGAAVGVALPGLLAPVLGLTAFTAGQPLHIMVRPTLIAGVVLFVLAGLAWMIIVEAAANRRLRLGRILRLGEDA